MKKSTDSARKLKHELAGYFLTRQTWICFGLMAVLYLFSMVGGMFSSPAFTYAEF